MKYLVFDCETTGLLPSCNVLTAYFIILDEKFNILQELDLKIKHPHYLIFTKALEINKINLVEHDKNAISINEGSKLIITFLKKYDTKYSIIGHNIQFDINMLKSNKLITDKDIELYFEKDYIDTYNIAQILKIEKKISRYQSLSLSKLCNFLEITIELDSEFHDAKYDCYSTIELYKKLLEIQSY